MKDLQKWLEDGHSFSLARELDAALDQFDRVLPVDGSLDDVAYREGYLPVKEGYQNASELLNKAGWQAEAENFEDARNTYEDAYDLLQEALDVSPSEYAFPPGLRSELEEQQERVREEYAKAPQP